MNRIAYIQIDTPSKFDFSLFQVAILFVLDSKRTIFIFRILKENDIVKTIEKTKLTKVMLKWLLVILTNSLLFIAREALF